MTDVRLGHLNRRGPWFNKCEYVTRRGGGEKYSVCVYPSVQIILFLRSKFKYS